MGKSDICVALFLSTKYARLKSYLGVKPSAPPCLPTLPPYPGLQAEVQTALASVETQSETQTALVSVETQTEIQTASVSVGTQIEIRTAHVEVQTTPVSV